MDSLSNFKSKGGLYLRFQNGDEVRLRILTIDPLVSESSWENNDGETVVSTKYAFIVWNWDENKAQIVQVGPGLVKRFKQIHTSKNFGDIRKLDIVISATGESLQRRYDVQVAQTNGTLSRDMVNEAATIKLEDNIQDIKGRLSELEGDSEDSASQDEDIPVVEDQPKSGYEKAKEVRDKLGGEDLPEDFDLSSIPF